MQTDGRADVPPPLPHAPETAVDAGGIEEGLGGKREEPRPSWLGTTFLDLEHCHAYPKNATRATERTGRCGWSLCRAAQREDAAAVAGALARKRA